MAQIQFPNTLFGPGTFDIVVNDNNGVPASVLDAGLDFTVDATWVIDPLAALLLGGQWEVAAYVESIGPGPEQQVGATQVVALNGGTNFSTQIVVLTHRNNGVISDVAAVAEGPFLRIG